MATMKDAMRFIASLFATSAVWFLPTHLLAAECGDGIFDSDTEECDDGNTEPGDGCDASCQVECTEVGHAATEHTCLHGAFGPFADVVATADGETVNAAVSTPHTYYTVVLPGEPGENLSWAEFQPATSSPYAVYLKKQYPLRLLDEAGDEVEVVMEHAISSCSVVDSLTWVQVFEALDSDQIYTVEFGPSEEVSMSLAFESLPSFSVSLFVDADNDGHAARGAAVGRTWCVPPLGYLTAPGGDCDDNDPLTYPGAPEFCDGTNSNCNALDDEDEPGLCDDSQLGTICASFDEVTRCGCQSDDDCSAGISCSSDGQCETPASGSGGQGGATSLPGTGGNATPDDDDTDPDPDEPGEPNEGGAGPDDSSTGGQDTADDLDPSSDASTSGGGCSCSLATQRSGGPAWLLFVMPALWLLRGRDRLRASARGRPSSK